MTTTELLLCTCAVVASSTSQLCLKHASRRLRTIGSYYVLVIAGMLMLFSIIIAIMVLRTIQLSQIMPFAAGAYVLVPVGGRIFLGEHFLPRFWAGVISIIFGMYLTTI